MTAVEQAAAYHEHTKHYLDRFADYLNPLHPIQPRHESAPGNQISYQ